MSTEARQLATTWWAVNGSVSRSQRGQSAGLSTLFADTVPDFRRLLTVSDRPLRVSPDGLVRREKLIVLD